MGSVLGREAAVAKVTQLTPAGMGALHQEVPYRAGPLGGDDCCLQLRLPESLCVPQSITVQVLGTTFPPSEHYYRDHN